jgi:hypothetical protein
MTRAGVAAMTRAGVATMTRAVGAVAVALALGCGAPASKPPPQPDPAVTDATACARLCTRMETCGGAPQKCEERCERERAWTKAGFYAAFVTCVEREVGTNVCTPPDPDKRAGAIALCYSATLNVFASRDQGRGARRVLEAACRRRARCNPEAKVDVAQCVTELEARSQAAVLFLAVARDDLLAQMDGCISESACEEAEAMQHCTARALPQTGEGP